MKKNENKISKHSSKCTLTEIYKKKSGFLNPAIVTFQNGELKDSSLDLNVSLTPTNDGTNVQVETSFFIYKESQVNEKPRNQIIAIRNKTSNKIRLVEVDNAILINSALMATPAVNATTPEYDKKIKNLYKTFGGKKAVNQVLRSEKLNVSSMPVADELKQTITEIKVDIDESFNTSEMDSITFLLPPCHRDSTKVSDIYQIREILSEKELECLIREIKVMEENKFNPKEYSKFFIECYEEAQKSGENLLIRLAGILFVEILIKYLKIPAKYIASKKILLCPFSSVISEKLLNEFSIKKEFSVTRPQTMNDKCICYIIALSLICCNYQINLQVLQTAIPSLNLNRLLRLARIVGAVPLSKEGHIYVLKLPLPSLHQIQKGKVRKRKM